jgi:hypothetical protein
MAYVKEETSIYSVNVTSENGEIFSMDKALPTKSSYFKIHEMNGRHNDMELFEVIGEISKSGKDVKVVGIITRLADYNNKIVIPNISRFAENNDMSREALVKLLKRAVKVVENKIEKTVKNEKPVEVLKKTEKIEESTKIKKFSDY